MRNVSADHSRLDASAYTLTNGGSSTRTSQLADPRAKETVVAVHDLRWKFQDDSQLPKPRDFVGGPKRYRAGRGSSVPLNFNVYK